LISIKLMGLRDLNRAQGVLAGDQALTRFATLLSNCLASHYTIGRPSGTVFCVLLPGADDQAINLFLQQLNSIISSDQNLSEGGLTVHAGAAFCMVQDSCDSFFQRAESQMLQRIWA
jgi:GGDEF domain-containing protein